MILSIASAIDEAIRPPYNILAKVLVASMIYFTVMSIALLTFVILRREFLNRREKTDKKLKIQIHKLIIDFLYAPEGEISTELELSMVKSGRVKQIIIDTLISLRNGLSGPMHDKLKDLYSQSGLQEYSMKKLKSSQWTAKAKGIIELSAMDVEEAHDEIKLLVNHPNTEVSMEAKIALIRMNEREPLAFLRYTRQRLTVWEQIMIYHSLKNSYKHMPDFTAWLYSENDSVTEFCIEMILDFGQRIAQEDLVILIEHPSEHVREKAYRALTSINPVLASKILPANFDQETLTLKREIIRQLALCGPHCSHFLLSILKNEEYAILAFDTARSLMSSAEGADLLQKYSQEHNDDALAAIVTHLNDKYIYDRI
jgi:hypothetical protein